MEQCNKREQVLCVWGCGYFSVVGVGVGLDPVELVMMEVGMELPVSGKAQCPSLFTRPISHCNSEWCVVRSGDRRKERPVVVAAELDLIAVPMW